MPLPLPYQSHASSPMPCLPLPSHAAVSLASQGLELGHLLGKGSFGSVYYGTWLGTPVAVKVGLGAALATSYATAIGTRSAAPTGLSTPTNVYAT